MTTNHVSYGKSDAGKLHVWLGEGKFALAKPRRRALLGKALLVAFVVCAGVGMVAADTLTWKGTAGGGDGSTFDSAANWWNAANESQAPVTGACCNFPPRITKAGAICASTARSMPMCKWSPVRLVLP